RFLTEDPAGLSAGLNRYSYVANNPLGFNDPFGLSLATFTEGFLTGGITAILSAAAIGLLFGLIEGAAGGAATPVLLALGDLLAVAAAAAVVAQIESILKQYRDCPDQAHYEIGALLGGLLAFGSGAAGGASNLGRGTGRSIGGKARGFLQDEIGG